MAMPRIAGARALRSARHRALRLLASAAARGVRAVPFGARLEGFLLRRAWSLGSSEMLDRYLVSGYQNPRLNLQSVLLRHALIGHLFGSQFDQLMEEEVRFAVSLNEALRVRGRELGVTMGSYLDPEKSADVQRVEQVIADRQGELEARWRAALAGRSVARISVLEFACGSANDYRTFDAYGLAPYLEYLGIDLTAKNVENARRRFPDARFEVGDILELPYADDSFDFVIASDIFEHLSPDGMERALDEAARMARRGGLLTFFNMAEQPQHDVQQKRAYYWNRLSRPLIEERLRRHFSSVIVTPIAAWLRDEHGYAHSYNRHAYTIQAVGRTDERS
jgi:ubiquinone/menaquinone biosynthesis C-methylase UbiE